MFPHIPKARPAPVDDRVLAQLTQVARDAQHGNTTQAEAEWLISATAPLLEELACYRKIYGTAAITGGNVIALPVGGR